MKSVFCVTVFHCLPGVHFNDWAVESSSGDFWHGVEAT